MSSEMGTSKAAERTAYKSRTGRPLVWLFAVTWKRRKGKPREYIAVSAGGALQTLFMDRELSRQLKIPASWVDFKLHTIQEARKLAPLLMKQFRAARPVAERNSHD